MAKLVAIVDNDLVTSSNYGNSSGSSNSSSNSSKVHYGAKTMQQLTPPIDTLENDVWFPSEQPSYPAGNKGADASDELIDMEAVEELILNSCLHTKRPGLHSRATAKKQKQKKMQPRISQTTTYGSIVSERPYIHVHVLTYTHASLERRRVYSISLQQA